MKARKSSIVGRAILPAAAFQAAFPGSERALALRKGRLKAGCSQDWLPHNLGGMVSRIKKYAAPDQKSAPRHSCVVLEELLEKSADARCYLRGRPCGRPATTDRTEEQLDK